MQSVLLTLSIAAFAASAHGAAHQTDASDASRIAQVKANVGMASDVLVSQTSQPIAFSWGPDGTDGAVTADHLQGGLQLGAAPVPTPGAAALLLAALAAARRRR